MRRDDPTKVSSLLPATAGADRDRDTVMAAVLTSCTGMPR